MVDPNLGHLLNMIFERSEVGLIFQHFVAKHRVGDRLVLSRVSDIMRRSESLVTKRISRCGFLIWVLSPFFVDCRCLETCLHRVLRYEAIVFAVTRCKCATFRLINRDLLRLIN